LDLADWILISVSAISIGTIFVFHTFGLYWSFITEFIAGLLGVLVAFSLDRYIDRRRSKNDRKKLLLDLRLELDRITKQIEPLLNRLDKPVIFYSEIWDSAVSSGQLRLISSEQLMQFTRLYKFIRESNFTAEKIIDLDEEQEPSTSIDGRAFRKLKRTLRLQYLDELRQIKKQIELAFKPSKINWETGAS
jgi:hypothetical protein